MMDSTDMSTPVTRGELLETLGQLKLELRQDIQKAVAPLATKVELEIWGGALLAQVKQQLLQSEQRLHAELARHTSAIHESMRAQVTASAEQYADLPGRVSRLETAVFGPKPRSRRTRRRDR
jgi:hypothetical protein